MLVWSMLGKTSNFVNLLSQKYIFIFITLLLLVYFDSSFVDLSERFNLPEIESLSCWSFLNFCNTFYIY